MSEFKAVLRETLAEYRLILDDSAVDRLYGYNDLLIERNKVMNLTALTEPRDVALKHFADSLMLLQVCNIPEGASLIDVGTGAGFPGMALAIARPDLRVTLLDSLQKRLTFLEEVCAQLDVANVTTVHSRAEDGSHTALRDSFDVAVARAVAPLNVLSEYCLPYVKVGGVFLAMKGKSAAEELARAQNAVKLLCGEVVQEEYFTLGEAGERGVIAIRKTAPTPAAYPRKSKQIQNKPL